MVDGPAERETHDQQNDDRDGRLRPPLGQDFAEQMIRPIAVTQARQGVAHRHSSKLFEQYSANFRGQRPEPLQAAREVRVRAYFLRSLRFQQAVWLSAFSLVIGISVVYSEPFTEPGLAPDDSNHLIVPAICAAWVGTS